MDVTAGRYLCSNVQNSPTILRRVFGVAGSRTGCSFDQKRQFSHLQRLAQAGQVENPISLHIRYDFHEVPAADCMHVLELIIFWLFDILMQESKTVSSGLY